MNRQRTDVLMHLRKQLAEHDSTFLPGATAASAGTALEEVISEAAEGTSAEVGSIQVRLDTIGESRLEHVTARANVSGDIESLVLFLESIEAGPPTLAIREWSITGGSASLSPTQREMLRLDLVVEGLSRRIVRGRPR